MYEQINDRIDVIAIFGRTYQAVKPFKLRWNNKDYRIKKVGYRYKYKEGRNTIHVFTATDGASYFEMMFNAEDLTWILGRVADNEAN